MRMLIRVIVTTSLLLSVGVGITLPGPAQAAQSCLACHADLKHGFAPGHAALARNCMACHAGNGGAKSQAAAHRGLIAFPGNLDNAARACGRCHADKVAAVTHSLMNTGAGMVATTRAVFGEPIDKPGHNDLGNLLRSPADSLLRNLCASCHLGQNKTVHRLNATFDRGGGCLACHINAYPAGAHPALTAKVDDARCFGCHSRSSRISLNYVGLAQVSPMSTMTGTVKLEDGRRLAPHPDDVHHAAGMSCIDCHTEVGVMGIGQTVRHESAAVDISCNDCHANHSPRIDAAHWPPRFHALLKWVPFPVTAKTQFLVTARHGTPLWNIQLRTNGVWLYPKHGGPPLRIPPVTAANHPLAAQHARLTCSACHSQWAPQCYSCHLSYNAKGRQWDHVARKVTAGAWEQRAGTPRNTLPPLGVDANGRIVPVVPAMIVAVEYPLWPQPRFVRRFAAIAPHTTGPARSCVSCHRSSAALGLGLGLLTRSGTSWHFKATERSLADGLPADAWTCLGAPPPPTITTTVRPLSAGVMLRILNVSLDRPASALQPLTPDTTRE